jgi:hypothetical protein
MHEALSSVPRTATQNKEKQTFEQNPERAEDFMVF